MAFLGWIEASWLAQALQANGNAYMAVNAAHILGLALLAGAIIPLDLRLLCALGRSAPLQVLAPFLSRCAAAGLLLAMLTGAALWSVRPEDYLGNAAFLWKMAIFALAITVAGVQHLSPGWRRVLAEGTAGPGVRVLAGASLVCWLSMLIAGRWIGFL